MNPPSTPPSPKRRVFSKRRAFLLVGVATVLALGLAEAALRIGCMENGLFLGRRPLPPFGAITNPRQAKWVSDWQSARASGEQPPGAGTFDPELGVTMLPNAASADGAYTTNSLGARGDREYQSTTPSGTARLWTFGDSFTFCSEVGDDETWQAALEASADNVEALNFGVGSYGTDQAWLRYRRLRERLSGPHLVTIGIMLENIARNVNRYRPIYYPGTPVVFAKPRFVLRDDQNSGEAPFGRLALLPLPFVDFDHFLAQVSAGSVVSTLAEHEYWASGIPGALEPWVLARLAWGFFDYRARQHRSLWEAPDEEPFVVTFEILRAFHEDASSAGALGAPVLVFPTAADLETRVLGEPAYWSTLLNRLEAAGIPALDLSEPLTQLCVQSGQDAAEVFVGGHLNPEANRAVARYVLDWVERHLTDSPTAAVSGIRVHRRGS